MIQLTKLDSSPMLVSTNAIKYIEETPDTIVFFLNGDSVVIRESIEEVRKKAIDFQKDVLRWI